MASNIGSDAWDRASFEKNAFTETSKYLDCLKKNNLSNNHPNAYTQCKKDTLQELDKQGSQDGKNLLKLLVAGITVKAVASTIENTAGIVINEKTSKNIAKSCSTIPEDFIIATAVPLGLNFIFSMIVSFYLKTT